MRLFLLPDGSFTWLWKDDRNEKTEFFKTMAMAERMIEKAESDTVNDLNFE
ncbi:MAG: hypothetical protein ACI4O6_07040 [Dysosmobacter sp.]